MRATFETLRVQATLARMAVDVRGWVLAACSAFVGGCAPVAGSARGPQPSMSPGVKSERPPLARLEAEEELELPPKGVVSELELSKTSTDGFPSDPLVGPWLNEGAPLTDSSPEGSGSQQAGPDAVRGLGMRSPVPPVLSETGTVTFDLPTSAAPLVDEWVEFLGSRGRKWFRTWLARSTRYVPLFYEVLDRYQLPRDLVFLAMVESGFSPLAVSWASAAGPWQFMPRTARRYGLRVGFWVDERRDFERSTEAAARHLSWLYSVFEDWHLAMAAYNAGSGRMRNALRRGRVNDYWQLQNTRRIRPETKRYIPKILASAIIAKEPERFGFHDVPYQPPLTYSTVTVTVATSLETIGEACGGLPAMALEELNPSLRVSVTPPEEVWSVRVPSRLRDVCLEGLESIPFETRMTFRYHEASVGEPLAKIARIYGTSAEAILRFHGVQDEARMLDYAEIAVPVPLVRAHEIPVRLPSEERQRGHYTPGDVRLVRYRIRPGDSLWKVSRRFNVSLRSLRSWNALWNTNHLRLGQNLRVYVKPGGERCAASQRQSVSSVSGGTLEIEKGCRQARPRAPEVSSERRHEAPRVTPRAPQVLAKGGQHQVAEGESLWSIARRYGTNVERLRSLNDVLPGQILSIGQVLKVR